ncbi:hypothetical protein ABK040_003281 [Willaertia magna]
MNKLILYGNAISQPSRAIQWFLLIHNIPFDFKIIRVEKGDQFTTPFQKINPFKKIPVLQDGENYYFESQAILIYLFHKYILQNNKQNKIIIGIQIHIFIANQKKDSDNDRFIANQKKPTIADLLCYSELMQLLILTPKHVKHIWESDLFKNYLNICSWMKRMSTLEKHDEVFRLLYVFKEKSSELIEKKQKEEGFKMSHL